MIKDLGRI